MAVATDTTRIRRELALDGPLDAEGLLGFLGARAVPGVEEVCGSTYRRAL
jgi:AraC family transcriptional regulator of adaptative response / DNA-3-methyladenine glycosylase II